MMQNPILNEGIPTNSETETPPISLKSVKCLNCKIWFYENETSVCRFHPGTYQELFQSCSLYGMKSSKSWSCCSSKNEIVPGCIVGPHTEDKKITEILSRFEKPDPMSTVTPSTPPCNLVLSNTTLSSSKLKKGSIIEEGMVETENFKQLKDGTFFYKYPVTSTDTLAGIGLKLKQKIETLKAINSIHSDFELYSRNFIYVPWQKDVPYPAHSEQRLSEKLSHQRHTVKLFMRLHNLEEYEAMSYLSENGFDVQEAEKALKADIDWENQQKALLAEKNAPTETFVTSGVDEIELEVM